MKIFESFLAPRLNEFIEYRRNLGYATKHILSHLRTFDRYLKEKKTASDVLEPSFFLEFRAALKIEPRSINAILYTVQYFFQYLVRMDDYRENPVKGIPPLPENEFIPFIFSVEQTDQLITAVSKRIRKAPKGFFKDLSVYMAIVLIARCGLRIKEPLRLELDHYRPEERTIYIEKTKFKKDRLIPVPKSVAADIDNYLAVRNTLRSQDQNPYLLPGINERKLDENRVRRIFHQGVVDIDLHQPRQIIGQITFAAPTPHSLRHSFAVNTLKSVKQRGISPENALPVMAVYKKKKKYKHTIKYLKVIDADQRQGLLSFALSKREDL